MVDSLFHSGSYSSPAYIAYILTAYIEVYGWNRLNDLYVPPYASMMPGLFSSGSKTWREVQNQLPSTFSTLMNSTFVSNFINGNEPDLQAAIQQNTLLDWIPQTPIHFFHGDADDVVSYQNASTPVNRFTANERRIFN